MGVLAGLPFSTGCGVPTTLLCEDGRAWHRARKGGRTTLWPRPHARPIKSVWGGGGVWVARSVQPASGTAAGLEPGAPEPGGDTDRGVPRCEARGAVPGCDWAPAGGTGPGSRPHPDAQAGTGGGLHPPRPPAQAGRAAAPSPAWAPGGARGDAPGLPLGSWLKLVWAGCGLGGLHSRPQTGNPCWGLPEGGLGTGAGLSGSAPRGSSHALLRGWGGFLQI